MNKDNNNDLLFNIQELDRQRIARDLHDTSLQSLAHLIHKIELTSLYMDKDIIQAKLELAYISKNINLIIDEIRNTIFDLHPMQFDDFGLRNTIIKFIEKEMKIYDSMIQYDIDDIGVEDYNKSLTIYRIMQESINNACSHSKGSSVIVSLKKVKDSICIKIEDDGIGFDINNIPNDNHFGLLILKERVESLAGTIDIVSRENSGTKIIINIAL